MRTRIIGLTILASIGLAVNAPAQSAKPAATPAAPSFRSLGAPPPTAGPPENASPEFLVAEGNALLAAGYTDAAIQDFQRVVNIAPDTSPTVSKGWLGLAQAYMAQGNTELAKTSVEQVLTLNTDPPSSDAARQLYITAKSKADLAVSQAMQAYQYYQYRFYTISFFNFISKYFAWEDMKNARAALQNAQQVASSFNPRFLIPPVAVPGGSRASDTATSSTTLTNLLSGIQMPVLTSYGTPVTGVFTPPPAGAQASASASALPNTLPSSTPGLSASQGSAGSAAAVSASGGSSAATPSTAAAAPADNLSTTRQAYLAAYQKLQTALGSGDASAIQAATASFQQSMTAYNNARAAAEASAAK